MHIEVREKDDQKKYYMAHSFREGRRVRKVRVYLGANLSPEELKAKRKDAEKRLEERLEKSQAIRDPYVSALSPSELKELETLETRGELRVLHLSEMDWTKFKEAFTYDTNAIEGSRVEAKEVVDILEKQKWPKDKTKEDISETYGVAEAVDYTRKTREHVSLKLIKELHGIVFKNSKPFAGKFRSRGVEVVVADAYGNVVHRGAPSAQVEKLLKKLVGWYNGNKKKYPPLVLAAVVHNQFENVHPFQDGNGRVGRLLLNNVLLRHGLPPVNIELRNRTEYYEALQADEKRGDILPMLELILKEYRTLKKMLRKR
ncbi:MAG: Fic family protein [Candidatus Micrarchaeota archaeon]